MTSRVLGILSGIFLGLLVLWTFSDWSWTRLFFLLVLILWYAQGWGTPIPVGSAASLLFFGQRTDTALQEGSQWTPWPFGRKTEDVRLKTETFGGLEAQTADKVVVFVDGAVSYRVTNPSRFQDVDPEDFELWLDTTRKQTLRLEIVQQSQEDAMKMHGELSNALKTALQNAGSDDMGIEIVKVSIDKILPDPKTAEALALKEREVYERKGQRVEAVHFAKLVIYFKSERGGSLSQARAEEEAQIIIHKITKNIDRKDWSLDPSTAEIVASVLAGRRP